MSGKFWRKCGKLISENGVPVRCKSSPCGFFAVVGIKYRALDCDTLEPINECSWQYETNVYNIKQGYITWQGQCISVEEKQGQMASKVIKLGCHMVCTETDPLTEQCIEWKEQCTSCYQVKLYNLTGCTDNYEDFKQEFFANCGPYVENPQIWVNDSLTNEASNCLRNYWQGRFQETNALNYTVRWQILGQCWWQYALWYEEDYETYTYSYCQDSGGNWCNEIYDENGHVVGCQDPNCSVVTYTEKLPIRTRSAGTYCYMMAPPNDAVSLEKYVRCTARSPQGQSYNVTCQDQRACYGGMAEINAYISEYGADTSAYGIYSNGYYYGSKGTGESTHTCTNGNNLCTTFTYTSGPFQNYYGDLSNDVTMYRWAKFKVERTNLTPVQAIGVRFQFELKHIQQNTGYGHEASSSSSTVSSLDMLFADGWKQDLPTATDITLWTLLKNIVCSGDRCDGNVPQGCKIHMQPLTNDYMSQYTGWTQNIKYDSYQIKLKGTEYIYSNE